MEIEIIENEIVENPLMKDRVDDTKTLKVSYQVEDEFGNCHTLYRKEVVTKGQLDNQLTSLKDQKQESIKDFDKRIAEVEAKLAALK